MTFRPVSTLESENVKCFHSSNGRFCGERKYMFDENQDWQASSEVQWKRKCIAQTTGSDEDEVINIEHVSFASFP